MIGKKFGCRFRVKRKELILSLLLFIVMLFLFTWKVPLDFSNLKRFSIDETGIAYLIDDRGSEYYCFAEENNQVRYLIRLPKYDLLKKEIYRYPHMISAGGCLYLHMEVYDENQACVEERVLEIASDGSRREIFRIEETGGYNVFLYDSFSVVEGALYFFANEGMDVWLYRYDLEKKDSAVRQSARFEIEYIAYNDLVYLGERGGVQQIAFADEHGDIYKSDALLAEEEKGSRYLLAENAYTDGLFYDGSGILFYADLKHDQMVFLGLDEISQEKAAQLPGLAALDKRSGSLTGNSAGFILVDGSMAGKTVEYYRDLSAGTAERVSQAKIRLCLLLKPSQVLAAVAAAVSLAGLLVLYRKGKLTVAVKLSLLMIAIIGAGSWVLYHQFFQMYFQSRLDVEKESISLYSQSVAEALEGGMERAGALNLGYSGFNEFGGKHLSPKKISNELYGVAADETAEEDAWGMEAADGPEWQSEPEWVAEPKTAEQAELHVLYADNLKQGLDIRYFFGAEEVALCRSMMEGVQGRTDELIEVNVREGRWLLALVPVLSPDGRVEAVLETGMNLEILEINSKLAAGSLAASLLAASAALLLILNGVVHMSLSHLKPLHQAVMRVSEGQYGYQTTVKGRDEIGQISKAFNRMSRSLKYNVENMQRFSQAASRFVPEGMVNLLEKENMTEVALGDYSTSHLTLVHVNIQQFHKVAARLADDEVLSFLNRFFGRLVKLVGGSGGFVESFHRSGFTGVYHSVGGAKKGSRADAAIACALAMRSLFGGQAENRNQGLETVELSVTVSSGSCLAAVIGQEDRVCFTLISQNKNILTILDGFLPQLGVHLLLTEGAFHELSAQTEYRHRYLGRFISRSLGISIGIYDFFDTDPPSVRRGKEYGKEIFSEGVSFFYERQFEEARKRFIQSLVICRQDKTAQLYLKLCDEYTAGGSVPEQLGIYGM